MTDQEERSYILGRQAVIREVVSRLYRELPNKCEQSGVDSALYLSRIRSALRRACEDHGDNDWSDDLDLVDVIEKHLVPYLEHTEKGDSVKQPGPRVGGMP